MTLYVCYVTWKVWLSESFVKFQGKEGERKHVWCSAASPHSEEGLCIASAYCLPASLSEAQGCTRVRLEGGWFLTSPWREKGCPHKQPPQANALNSQIHRLYFSLLQSLTPLSSFPWNAGLLCSSLNSVSVGIWWKRWIAPRVRSSLRLVGSAKLDTFCKTARKKARVGHLSPVPDWPVRLLHLILPLKRARWVSPTRRPIQRKVGLSGKKHCRGTENDEISWNVSSFCFFPRSQGPH